ncbi:hypothetical protein Zmor_025287 [Zophobas morio]|uniref:27 kDa hemolymph protein n=1 Tax=Zophobas morio TaxID=2755281 RepID=A0AA38M4S5_9CUCU|nr:hypothetical protein Zmor_025287 [Zophobas morio]
MKKYIFVAFALFAVIGGVKSDSSEEVLEEIKSKHLKKYLSSHKENIDEGFQKLEEHCPGVTEKLKQAVKSFKECDDKADDSLTICHAIQSYTLNCTAPVIQVIDDCLPPRAKGLPKFGLESIVSVADFLCKQTGESIFELANPCLWEDVEDEQEDQCIENLKELSGKFGEKDDIPSKIEICSATPTLRGCIQTRATTHCKNQKTRNAILGFFDAVVAPCKQVPLETLTSATKIFTSPKKSLGSITDNFL